MLSFIDVNDYMKALKQPRMWRPMLYRILSHHKIVEISDQFRPNIVSLQDGTNPVFFVHGWKIREGQVVTSTTQAQELESVQCVIKLSSSYFAGSKGFKTETRFYEYLTQHQPPLATVTPRMLAKGVLAELYEQQQSEGGDNEVTEAPEPHHPHYTPYPHFSYDQVWPWPYIVLTYVTALPVIRVFDRLTREDMTRTCEFLVQWMPQLHQLSPTGPRTWHEFTHFVAKQRRSCRARQQEWQLLSANLIAELDSYLPRDARELFRHARDQSPVYLHGDLSDEQVLGVMVDSNEHVINIDPRGAWPEGVKWKPVSLIDFGDTLIGDTTYELVAIHLALFRCDKHLLAEFVKQFPADYFGPRATLAYRCMCYTLIHVQDAIRTVWMTHPEWCPVPYPTPHMRSVEGDSDSHERQLRDGVVPPRREFASLKELEQLLWGVEEWLH